jgi:hypothetical protein
MMHVVLKFPQGTSVDVTKILEKSDMHRRHQRARRLSLQPKSRKLTVELHIDLTTSNA